MPSKDPPSTINLELQNLATPQKRKVGAESTWNSHVKRQRSIPVASSSKLASSSSSSRNAKASSSRARPVVKSERTVKSEQIVINISDDEMQVDDDEIQFIDPAEAKRIAAEEKLAQERRDELERLRQEEESEEEYYESLFANAPWKPIPYKPQPPADMGIEEAMKGLRLPSEKVDTKVGIKVELKPSDADNRPLNSKRRKGGPHYRRIPPRTSHRMPEPVYKYQLAGAVNKILQVNGSIAVCTSVIKGGTDEMDPLENLYDKTDSLCLFHTADHTEDAVLWWPITKVDDLPEHKAQRTGFKRTIMVRPNHSHVHRENVKEGLLYDPARDEYIQEDGSCVPVGPTSEYAAEVEVDDFEMAEERADMERFRQNPLDTRSNEFRWQSYEFDKLYTVNSIAYDPQSDLIASSGMDCKIRFTPMRSAVHTLGSGCPGPLDFKRGVPYELAYGPQSLQTHVLAVAGKQIVMYYDLFSENPSEQELSLTSKPKYVVGSMCWGRGPTADQLFASTETSDESAGSTGFHKAFQPFSGKKTSAYSLDAKGSGDEMAVSHDGKSLALITSTSSSERCLRIFDIARKRRDAALSTMLVPFAARPDDPHYSDPQVNSLSYSPCGTYLAAARTDNSVHIYDARFLKGPVNRYEHRGESMVELASAPAYGIVQAEWVNLDRGCTRRGLVTGGEDGCVRIWDLSVGPDDRDNGLAIAKMDCDVARFCLGDWSKGEHALVVGGSAGRLCVFNNIPYFYKLEEGPF